MSRGAHDIFTLVINLKTWLGAKTYNWLFDASKTLGQALANNLKNLLEQYGLTKTITYVKDEAVNMNAMKIVVNCETLDEIKSF